MRVLIVEDERDLGEVFCDFLVELGHQALLVRSAEAALGKLETERPDAIILDIHLPGMSGLDFLQLRPIRESGVPVVAVSGVATESQARECLKLGALDFVGKPVPFERLSQILAILEPHALHRRSAEAEQYRERRRAPRALVGIPVRAAEYNGTEWTGTSVDLSPFGMKLRPDTPLEPGATVKLAFTPPDGGRELLVVALFVRTERDGHTFSFVNLRDAEFQRLSTFVQRL
ncbi:MAG: response regulator [Candidatus Rokubacteria bacterium]|nr:response regulator [Candidatus Rokubacteria bacterium]